MPLHTKQLNPGNLRPPEFFEAFNLIKFVNDDETTIVYSKPIVEGSLSSFSGNFEMLSDANFDGLGRKAYIAIDELRPEPDRIDNTSGRWFSSHAICLSAARRHNMQLTQFSTCVPSRAIWRSRM